MLVIVVYNAAECTLAVMERGACPVNCIPQRSALDRRRLADTWYRWQLRNLMEQSNILEELTLKGLSMKAVDEAIEQHLPALSINFIKRWGGHRCGTPGKLAPAVYQSLVFLVLCEGPKPDFPPRNYTA
jgi:hypothetical protein